jgi:phage shock protein PspC (stress-responsive transcriptional regulator)
VSGDVVRVVWIFLSLLGGVGILPYAAAVFVFPEAAQPAAAAAPRTARNAGLALVAIGGWLLLRAFGLHPLGAGAIVWPWQTLAPLALLAGAVLLLSQRTRELVTPGGRARRSVSNRILSGVCGGIARECGVDANLLRVGFVFAAMMTTGVGILAYLLLTFLLPEEEVSAAAPPVAPATADPAEESEPAPVAPSGSSGQAPPDGYR